jgi:hypothetical protein
VNLAWKLAAVLNGGADASILDSYEPERIAFARRLVATTDRAFTGVTSRGTLARLVRLHLVPLVIPPLFKLPQVRRFMFLTISQTRVDYRGSSLSEGRAGKVHGGDRLPWVKLDGVDDNFNPLASMDWQVHVYGHEASAFRTSCNSRKLPLHVFPWRLEMEAVGLGRNAAYLVRPDGYVGLADPEAREAVIASYLDTHKVIPRGA